MLKRPGMGRLCGASPRPAPDAGAAVPAVDQISGDGNRLKTGATTGECRPDRISCGCGAARTPRVNAAPAKPAPLGELIARLSAPPPKPLRPDLGAMPR